MVPVCAKYQLLEVSGKLLVGPRTGLLWGLLDSVLHALRPCDPRDGDWIVRQDVGSVLACGQRICLWIVY